VVLCFSWLQARHEAVIGRTLERNQKTKQKPNRWSWGGPLQTNTPSTPAGTFTPSRCTQYLQKLTELRVSAPSGSLNTFEISYLSYGPDVRQRVSCVNMSACLCVSVLFCHVYIWTLRIPCPLLLLLTHTLLCPSHSLFLSLSSLLSTSLSHPGSRISLYLLSALCFLCHCPFPSWSRLCRVGFPLSTRPCRTGAHAGCFQSLPQIRSDLPTWILKHCVS